MRKIIWSIVLLSSYWTSYCQESTISTNIYENNGKLGIGITTPENDFTIEGNYSSGLERNLIKLNNLDDGSMSYTGIILKTGDSNLMSVIQDYGTNYTASVPYDFGGFLNLSNNSSGLMLHANSEHGIIKFFTGHDDVAGAGIERLRINSDGKIGIGTKSPEFLLHLKSNSDNYSTIPRQFIQLENENDGDHSNVAIALSSGTDANMGSASFGVTAKSYSINSFGGYAYMYNVNNGILLRANSENSKIRFFTGGDGEEFERMHIDSMGNIGINTNSPEEKLDINGGIKIANSTNEIAGIIRWTGDNFEGYNGLSWLSFTDSCTNQWQNNSYGVHLNGGNVGIGTTSPDYLLHLKSNSDNFSSIPRQFIRLENENDGEHSNVAIALSSGTDANIGSASFGVTAQSYSINSFGGYAYMYNTNNGILLRANSENSKIRFFTGGDGEEFERMHIDSIGNVGIGTSKPNARVEIADGDIYISDIEKGIIMKSPDGQCWRGTLDNNGSLTFTQVDCPSVSTTTKATESVILSKKEISIYPNPTKDIIIVDVKSLDSKDLKYCIYDINGNLMRSNILESNYNQIDISFLSNGYYLLNINNINGNQLISEKIIKQ